MADVSDRIDSMVSERLRPMPLEDIDIRGEVAERAEAVTEARYLSERADSEVLQEAVDAFRNRVDDRMDNERGFWQGEFWGKWMLGAVQAARYTGSEALRSRIARGAGELIATQDADGYIGTYHDSTCGWSDDPERQRLFEWNVWCRKYTLWGLLEAHALLGDEAILEAARRFMDHLASQVGPGGWDIIRTGQFAGLPSTSILTPVLFLYRRSGEQRYLDYARYIVEQWSANPQGPPDLLRKGLTGEEVIHWFEYPARWAKGYELLSCVEGMVEMYRTTGEDEYLTAAKNIFDSVARTDRNVYGGVSRDDRIAGGRYLVNTPSEICDSVYWVRLAARLLAITGEARYADEIELTLTNVLLAGPGLNPFWGLRRQLQAGAHWIAPQHCRLKTHHCCVANLPRGLYEAMSLAVLAADAGPAVALYLPGSYRLSEGPVAGGALEIDTEYPHGDTIRVKVDPPAEARFVLRLRQPAWSGHATVTVDGQQVDAERQGGWLAIERTWRPGEVVELSLDMAPRVVDLPHPPEMPTRAMDLPYPPGMPGQPFRAVFRGPVALARDIRLGDAGNIHESVGLIADEDQRIELTPAPAPENIRIAYTTRLRHPRMTQGDRITLCDFASAGNTWNRETSDFRLWLEDPCFDPNLG